MVIGDDNGEVIEDGVSLVLDLGT